MTRHFCYRFSASRHRGSNVALEPHFLRPVITPDVGYLPLLLDDLVVLSFTSGQVKALDKVNGGQRWAISLSSAYKAELPFRGAAVFNGVDLFVGDRDELIIVDPLSGVIRDRHSIREINLKNAAPMPDGLIAAYREGDSYRVGFFRSSEAAGPAWSVPAELPLDSIAVLGNICCFAPTFDELVALDSQTGAQLWRFSAAKLGRFEDDLGRTRSGEISGEAILWNDLVIAGLRANLVIALEAKTGQMRWICTVDDLTPSNLTLDASGILHLLSPVRYYRIEASSGTVISSIEVGRELERLSLFPLSHMDISTTHVFCAGVSGTVFALAQATGKVVWTNGVERGAPFSHYPLASDDCLYYLDGRGTLLTFPDME